MEAFESFVAIALETEGLIVSEAVKFPVARQTAKSSIEIQQHGYEVDLGAARADLLVLATVKSFFGSRGVVFEHVAGTSGNKRGNDGYRLLNDPVIRDGVMAGAGHRYGYPPEQIELRLYAGRFAGRIATSKDTHEAAVRRWCDNVTVGRGPIRVYNVAEVVARARTAAARTEYRDNAALVAMKVLDAAGQLKQP